MIFNQLSCLLLSEGKCSLIRELFITNAIADVSLSWFECLSLHDRHVKSLYYWFFQSIYTNSFHRNVRFNLDWWCAHSRKVTTIVLPQQWLLTKLWSSSALALKHQTLLAPMTVTYIEIICGACVLSTIRGEYTLNTTHVKYGCRCFGAHFWKSIRLNFGGLRRKSNREMNLFWRNNKNISRL